MLRADQHGASPPQFRLLELAPTWDDQRSGRTLPRGSAVPASRREPDRSLVRVAAGLNPGNLGGRMPTPSSFLSNLAKLVKSRRSRIPITARLVVLAAAFALP